MRVCRVLLLPFGFLHFFFSIFSCFLSLSPFFNHEGLFVSIELIAFSMLQINWVIRSSVLTIDSGEALLEEMLIFKSGVMAFSLGLTASSSILNFIFC